jgi:NitT/TauT family transport system substrate-binding protein
MERRTFLVGTAATALAAGIAPNATAQPAGAPEKAKVVLGVGGKALLYYLPLTIAERKGFFKEEGLEVEINDLAGGARSLQSLVGGSVDVVTGAYEHTIRMQAKGQDIRAVVELGRFPAIVIAVRKEKAGQIKSAADFKGAKIGVTAPGSSTALTAQYAMVKAGLKPTDAAYVGVGGGAGAVAAMKKGEIDLISHLDPVIAKLEADGDVQVLIDTRTEAGTRALFGGSNPAATLYSKKDFIDRNPVTTQRLVNAFVKSLKWLQTAKPDDVADLVPAEYHLGDKPLYIKAVQNSLESYSRTGIVTPEGMTSVMDMLKQLDPELKDAKVDLATTFDDRFVRKAGG